MVMQCRGRGGHALLQTAKGARQAARVRRKRCATQSYSRSDREREEAGRMGRGSGQLLGRLT
jgi:hypothetical protein